MTYGDLRRYADTLDVTVCSRILPNDLNGFYNEAVRTIIIDRRMTYTQKRCTLTHELIHWAHADDFCEAAWRSRAEARTRRQTALTLVSPAEYQTAERAYDGDPYQIACDLDVTLQVIKDYQRMLDDMRAVHPYRRDWNEDVLVGA